LTPIFVRKQFFLLLSAMFLGQFILASAYGAGALLEKAVEHAGSFDQDKLRNALAQLETTTVFGAYKVAPTGAQLAHEAVIVQILDQKKIVVGPEKVKAADAVFPFPAWEKR